MVARALLAALFVVAAMPRSVAAAPKAATPKPAISSKGGAKPIAPPKPHASSAPAPPVKPAPSKPPAPKPVAPKSSSGPPAASAHAPIAAPQATAPQAAAPPSPTPPLPAASSSAAPSSAPPSPVESASDPAPEPARDTASTAPAEAKSPAAPVAPPRATPPPAPIAVDIRATSSAPAWFASGLEEVVGDELRRFHDVAVAPKIDRSLCPTGDANCLVARYRDAGAQVVVLGEVGGGALRYGVYEGWTGARAFDGSLRVSGITQAALAREIGDIVRPIVHRGGLLDQRPAPAPREASSPAATLAWLRDARFDLVVASILALLASPVLLLVLLVGGRALGRRATPASWKWTALFVGALAAIPIATRLVDVPTIAARWIARAPPIVALLSPVAAGMLWGAFALAAGVWLFAPLRGLERIRHDALWRVVRSWATLFVLRAAALALLYGVPILLAVRASAAAALPSRLTFAVIVPLAGLLAHFWLLSLVDNLSVYLDVRLVSGAPTERNPWHATIARYFGGYVRRGVIDVDARLRERTLFLPGRRDDVIVYGGGFARPRIVVGERPLERALGELPDEESLPDRTVNADELPAGVLLPAMGDEADRGKLARAEDARRRLTRSPPRARAHVPRVLGENATLLGWVLPQKEAGIPLISDTEEDFGVVKRLLSEHYAAFEAVLEDDEVDDTDPTQKDFLFGALLREVGVVARHDVYFATLARSLEVATSRGGWLARLLRAPLSTYERFFSLPGARVADAYAALNGALHPLVQHLCAQRGVDDALLTARANAARLMETSRRMLLDVERSEPSPEERDAFRATPRDRVVWLTDVFHGRMAPASRVRWGRVLAGGIVAAAATVLIVRSVSQAIAYHPIYVERMKSQAAKAAQGDHVR